MLRFGSVRVRDCVHIVNLISQQSYAERVNQC